MQLKGEEMEGRWRPVARLLALLLACLLLASVAFLPRVVRAPHREGQGASSSLRSSSPSLSCISLFPSAPSFALASSASSSAASWPAPLPSLSFARGDPGAGLGGGRAERAASSSLFSAFPVWSGRSPSASASADLSASASVEGNGGEAGEAEKGQLAESPSWLSSFAFLGFERASPSLSSFSFSSRLGASASLLPCLPVSPFSWLTCALAPPCWWSGALRVVGCSLHSLLEVCLALALVAAQAFFFLCTSLGRGLLSALLWMLAVPFSLSINGVATGAALLGTAAWCYLDLTNLSRVNLYFCGPFMTSTLQQCEFVRRSYRPPFYVFATALQHFFLFLSLQPRQAPSRSSSHSALSDGAQALYCGALHALRSLPHRLASWLGACLRGVLSSLRRRLSTAPHTDGSRKTPASPASPAFGSALPASFASLSAAVLSRSPLFRAPAGAWLSALVAALASLCNSLTLFANLPQRPALAAHRQLLQHPVTGAISAVDWIFLPTFAMAAFSLQKHKQETRERAQRLRTVARPAGEAAAAGRGASDRQGRGECASGRSEPEARPAARAERRRRTGRRAEAPRRVERCAAPSDDERRDGGKEALNEGRNAVLRAEEARVWRSTDAGRDDRRQGSQRRRELRGDDDNGRPPCDPRKGIRREGSASEAGRWNPREDAAEKDDEGERRFPRDRRGGKADDIPPHSPYLHFRGLIFIVGDEFMTGLGGAKTAFLPISTSSSDGEVLAGGDAELPSACSIQTASIADAAARAGFICCVLRLSAHRAATGGSLQAYLRQRSKGRETEQARAQRLRRDGAAAEAGRAVNAGDGAPGLRDESQSEDEERELLPPLSMSGSGGLAEDPSEELRLVMSYVHSLCPHLPMAAIGLSHGGNTLLRLLSPLSPSDRLFARAAQPSPSAACALSSPPFAPHASPFDLKAASSASTASTPSSARHALPDRAPVAAVAPPGVALQPTVLPPACCGCCRGFGPFPCATTALAYEQRRAERRHARLQSGGAAERENHTESGRHNAARRGAERALAENAGDSLAAREKEEGRHGDARVAAADAACKGTAHVNELAYERNPLRTEQELEGNSSRERRECAWGDERHGQFSAEGGNDVSDRAPRRFQALASPRGADGGPSPRDAEVNAEAEGRARSAEEQERTARCGEAATEGRRSAELGVAYQSGSGRGMAPLTPPRRTEDAAIGSATASHARGGQEEEGEALPPQRTHGKPGATDCQTPAEEVQTGGAVEGDSGEGGVDRSVCSGGLAVDGSPVRAASGEAGAPLAASSEGGVACTEEDEAAASRRKRRSDRRAQLASSSYLRTKLPGGLPFPHVFPSSAVSASFGPARGPSPSRSFSLFSQGTESSDSRHLKGQTEATAGASAVVGQQKSLSSSSLASSLQVASTGAAALSYLGGLWSRASAARKRKRPFTASAGDAALSSASRDASEAPDTRPEQFAAPAFASAASSVLPLLPFGSGPSSGALPAGLPQAPSAPAEAHALSAQSVSVQPHVGLQGGPGRDAAGLQGLHSWALQPDPGVSIASILSAVVCVGPLLDMHQSSERRNASFAGLFDRLCLEALATDGLVSWLHGLASCLAAAFASPAGAKEQKRTTASRVNRQEGEDASPRNFRGCYGSESGEEAGHSGTPPPVAQSANSPTRRLMSLPPSFPSHFCCPCALQRWLAAYAEALFFEGAPHPPSWEAPDHRGPGALGSSADGDAVYDAAAWPCRVKKRQPLLACRSSYEVDCWLAQNALRLEKVQLLSPCDRGPADAAAPRRPVPPAPVSGAQARGGWVVPSRGAIEPAGSSTCGRESLPSRSACASPAHAECASRLGRDEDARESESGSESHSCSVSAVSEEETHVEHSRPWWKGEDAPHTRPAVYWRLTPRYPGGVSEFYDDFSAAAARLDKLPVPALIFMAMDDPISDFKAVDLFACCRNANVAFAVTQTGSHCTHLAGSKPRVFFARAAVEFLTKALTSCTWPLPRGSPTAKSDGRGKGLVPRTPRGGAGLGGEDTSPQRCKW
ncbi:hypothetical protein BESB_005880 [Besnoitia besnoiti]|uniref:Transmembrane protein n=1 Tax=Besnoitia besnoiti TaxID=94643 RepID=A0A2A9MQ32_BESBE|nr:hypothetical protein BESB_005880 [Besnoitia besnoiti]PFH38247.1 hypothetical protein BESB_005880 [Besnoitia besnoiti]